MLNQANYRWTCNRSVTYIYEIMNLSYVDNTYSIFRINSTCYPFTDVRRSSHAFFLTKTFQLRSVKYIDCSFAIWRFTANLKMEYTLPIRSWIWINYIKIIDEKSTSISLISLPVWNKNADYLLTLLTFRYHVVL